MGLRVAEMGLSPGEKKFKHRFKTFLAIIKHTRSISNQAFSRRFEEFTEKYTDDPRSCEAIRDYLKGRTKIGFIEGINLLEFLSQESWCHSDEVFEFVKPYIIQLRGIIDKFEDVSREKRKKYEL